MVPVKKEKYVTENCKKTVMGEVPKTKVIRKQVQCSMNVPVYSVVCKSMENNNNNISQEYRNEFKALDLNADGHLSLEEYAQARQGAGQASGGGYGQASGGGGGMAMASGGAAMQSSGMAMASGGAAASMEAGLQSAAQEAVAEVGAMGAEDEAVGSMGLQASGGGMAMA